MSDRLDDLLARLPMTEDAPGSDLSARIIATVAVRRRAQVAQRRISLVTLTSALAGLALIVLSWPEAYGLASAALNVFETNALSWTLNAIATPWDTFLAAANALLASASTAEGVGAALVLGTTLLALAAFGGLAVLRPGASSMNGMAAQG